MTANDIWVGAASSLLTVLCVAPAAAAASAKFDLDEVYPIAPDGSIELVTRDADVTIVGSDRDDVHVEIHYERIVRGMELGSDDFRVDVTPAGGNLRIVEQASRGATLSIAGVRTRYTVLIEAPASVALDITGDDDDYSIRDIAGAIALHADDGRIRLQNCRGNAFDLTFEDGQLEMDRGEGALKLDFDDGDATIRNATFRQIDARANDGDLRLEGDLAEDGRYEVRFDDGDVDMQVGDAGGTFSFEFADGSLRLAGGSGSASITFDDGNARLSRTRFRDLDVRSGDGRFELDGALPPGAAYAVRLDDGSARLHVREGGGRLEASFGNGRVEVQGPVRLVSEAEHRASYEWGQGEASIRADFEDGLVSLSAGAR